MSADYIAPRNRGFFIGIISTACGDYAVETLKSELDQSVNFVEESLAGFIESRYVRRAVHYFACYLSSQTGCNKGCRFCHLTATKQTTFVDATPTDFVKQAFAVFDHYAKEKPAKFVHYNFMARGEALANQYLLKEADGILNTLGLLALDHGVHPKFNISTILPKTLDKSLLDVFKLMTPTIYYSMYSASDDFRKQWLPAALPVSRAMELLSEYQKATKKIVKIHYAFIKDQNDSQDDVKKVCDAIEAAGIVTEFNIVRYNPFSPDQGDESPEQRLLDNAALINSRIGANVKIIQRVGFDVKASCGMFVE
jgi:23S rRNA (adenine2503-C2)-methyltransferase